MRRVEGALHRAVTTALDGANRPALVILDPARELGDLGDDVQVSGRDAARASAAAQRFATVVLVVDDVVALRRTVSLLGGPGGLGRARLVGLVLATASAPVLLRVHPSWPQVTDVDARLVEDAPDEAPGTTPGAAAVTTAMFETRLDVVPVLTALARGAALPVVSGPAGVWLAGDVAPPVDPLFARAYDPAAECPPDVVTGGSGPYDDNPVTGRPPLGVPEPGEPLDEGVFNPHGFRRDWTRGMVTLPSGAVLTPSLVASLRDAQGVTPAPDADAALVAGLAMSGVPLERFDDPVERERHSVRTRRAALLEHATFAWRSRLGESAGVRHRLWSDDTIASTDDPDAVTDLRLARRYSGADLVVLPDDATGPTECFVTEPPAGAVLHARDRSPADIVAAGGLVYVARPLGVS